MANENNADVQVGKMLFEAKKALGLSNQKAADRARFSATQWRDMERGHRHGGAPVNASDATLAAAAQAVGLDPVEVFKVAGREYVPPPDIPVTLPPATAEELLATMRQLVETVERLADAIEAQP